MEAYQRGDADAFEALYARHSPKVYGYLRKRLRDAASADDVLQMVFMKFHHVRHQYRASLPFLPWLFTICRTVLIDHVRSVAREPEAIQFDEARDPRREKVPVTETVSLEDLGPEQRHAIELRYFQEQSFEQIAEALKKSPAGVRQMVSRGIRQLRKLRKKP